MIEYFYRFVFNYLTILIHYLKLTYNRLKPSLTIYRLRNRSLFNVTMLYYLNMLFVKKRDMFHIKINKDDMEYNLFTHGVILTNPNEKVFYSKKLIQIFNKGERVYFNTDILDDNYSIVENQNVLKRLGNILELLRIEYDKIVIDGIDYFDVDLRKIYE